MAESVTMDEYSVLMSVYSRESPDFLSWALDSIHAQTCPPNEIVLLKDGPLTAELDALIKANQLRPGPRLVVIGLERNVGLGTALQVGLEACAFPIVARMDSDDIAASTRCEKQLKFLETHPDVDAVGTWISEFQGNEDKIYARRVLPTSHEDITKFAKKRNPLNHMTVMLRKQSVLAAGGYRSFTGFEDYYLWVRMLVKGAKFANLPEFLVNARGGQSQLRRRGGLAYAICELKLQREMLRLGFINILEFARNVSLRFITRISPTALRKWIYRGIRRAPHANYL